MDYYCCFYGLSVQLLLLLLNDGMGHGLQLLSLDDGLRNELQLLLDNDISYELLLL